MKRSFSNIALSLILFSSMLSACSNNTAQQSPEAEISPVAEESVSPDSDGNEAETSTLQEVDSDPVHLPHSAELEGAVNARELGGYVTTDGKIVRENLLIRSGELTGMTEEDIRVLTDTYKLRDIIDLRQPDEIEAKPDPAIPGATYINLSVVPVPEESEETSDADAVKPPSEESVAEKEYENPYINLVLSMGDVREGMESVYTNLVTSEHSLEYFRQFFDILLADGEGAVLWHCTSGKDRTGVASALVLSALGVDRQTIVEDFMLTNEYLAEKIDRAVVSAKEETSDVDILEGVRILNGVDRSYIEATFEAIEQYGPLDSFLEEQLGLTEEKVQALRDKFLE